MEIKKYYENPHRFSVNTNGLTLPLAPYACEEDALALEGTHSSQVTALSKNWAYYTFASLIDIPEELFSANHPLEHYTTCSLPQWEEQEAFPFLIDPPYLPSEFGVQVFAKNLNLNRADDGQQRMLSLNGVYGGCYVYCNGQLVGFHGQSGVGVGFDLTPYLQTGSNRLVLVLTSLSVCNYLAPANKFGLLGKISLITRKGGGVHSLSLSYELPMDYKTATVQVEVDALCPEEVTLCLYTPDGELLYKSPVSGDGTCRFTIQNPALWSHETPECYTLLALYGGEVTKHTFGLRNLRVEPYGMFVNGRKVLLKGVSYSHLSASPSQMEQDLRQMKANHINTLALTHFPTKELLTLCDRYGLYVIAHSGVHTPYLEHCSHNFLAGDLTFRELLTGRMEALVAQSGHPCVIARCVGDHCGVGSNIKFALDTLRQLDPKTPAFCGGVTLLESDLVACTKKEMSLALEDGRPFLCYDFPTKDTEYSMGWIAGEWEGMKPRLYELQHLACPIGVELKDGATGEVTLTNGNAFTFFSQFECTYQITRYGKVVETGCAGIFSLPPTATETVQLPYHLPSEGECTLRLIFTYLGDTPYAKSGDLAGRFWFPLPVSARRNTAPVTGLLPEVVEQENQLHIYAAGCHYTLSTLQGKLTGMEYQGKNLLLPSCNSPLQFGCRGVSYSVEENCIVVNAQLKVGKAGFPATATLTKKFAFYPDGCVTVEPSVTPAGTEISRELQFSPALTHLQYYGFGGANAQSDEISGSYLGHFSLDLKTQAVEKAQGKVFRLTGSDGVGIAFFHRDLPFALSAKAEEQSVGVTLTPTSPFILKPISQGEDLWQFYNNTYQPIL